MTVLRDIFEKPVDRPIEGVIKADDDASLRIELEEYVLTNEIRKQVERFLDAYNNYTTANGVWISGFFGSGKSHLLKMLALLLENREVDGVRAYELFKDKCREDPTLRGSLDKAVATPSKSILFNIDQKADVISKDQIDALLSVFQKVFDETCGYYGKQAYIAQFERDLDSRGVFGAFKEAYQAVAGKPWERGREQHLLENKNIAKAYAQATGADASEADGILSRYRTDYKVSIEDFAEKVKGYVNAQGRNFRLNFFVDEVGQYIAENVKLMTNLQTIAESLNTKCRGRAWIIVTAQQDMNAVIGDMNERQENDFSKIQARFANRVPLNSADVAEVIQTRLLSKTSDGIGQLTQLYARESNNLRTLFDFADGSRSFRNFADRDHFIKSYPFIPYQYELFQTAIQGLSLHNAFEGRHSSVGERSMLGVFQEVAIHLANLPVGHIATFDLMFEGIRTALKSSVQQSIQIAERNLGDAFATRVLKALFLVKYDKSFKPTVRNVAILMREKFDEDETALRRRVEEALARLEQETYIQRNGDLFEFLTDEEKDVEQEIKVVDVDPSEVARELEALLFDGAIKDRKIRHETAGHEYSFTRKLDGRNQGREYELAVNIITPFNDQRLSFEAVRMASLSSDEMVVVMATDDRFARDVMMYKRTEKYVRQTRATAPQPSIERIIADKGQQNNVRYRDLTARARTLIADAQIFIRGEEIEIRGEDPQLRIRRAFQTLVDKVYTNLVMLRGVTYAEAEIGKYLRQTDDGALISGGNNLTEPQQEILNFAQSNARTAVRTTVKSVVERFEAKPYGWPNAAILCTLATLFAHGKVEAKSDGSPVEGTALERDLKNSHALGNLVLELQIEFTAAQVRALRDFHKDMFDSLPGASDGKGLAKEVSDAIGGLIGELRAFTQVQAQYPFMSALVPVSERLQETHAKPYGWYFTDLPKRSDDLLDDKERIIDPIRRFMGGNQRTIYDEAREFLARNENNLAYLADSGAEDIRAVLQDPNCFKGNTIQALKAQLDELAGRLAALIAAEQKAASADIEERIGHIESAARDHGIEGLPAEIKSVCSAALAEVASATIIPVIRDRANKFSTDTYPALLGRLDALAPRPEPPAPPPPPKPTHPTGHTGDNGGSTGSETAKPIEPTTPQQPAPPPVQFVPQKTLKVKFAKGVLATEADVDAYLQSYRETLLAEIRSGKRITI
ncbi:MAG: hypothetical protein B7Y35_07475 [Sphingomonadales bacterium 28-64-96]|nr:MAG: hypothetical protein B7Y35_07475 [Sphingomonadales bacterium 28-64-96]